MLIYQKFLVDVLFLKFFFLSGNVLSRIFGRLDQFNAGAASRDRPATSSFADDDYRQLNGVQRHVFKGVRVMDGWPGRSRDVDRR